MEVDLCFVMDCTGSMSRHIEGAKDCIIKVTEEMARKEPAVKIRFGFCGYRDHCDGSDRLQISDTFPGCFTNSNIEYKNYIATVEAKGGGDSPEDVLGGLDAAITKMDWHNKNRVLIHVGDCPPHGRRFHNLDDDHPDGDPYGLTAESVLNKLKSENILYFFGKITEETNTMNSIFKEIIGNFLVFELSAVRGNPALLVEKFTHATCEAIKYAISLNE